MRGDGSEFGRLGAAAEETEGAAGVELDVAHGRGASAAVAARLNVQLSTFNFQRSKPESWPNHASATENFGC